MEKELNAYRVELSTVKLADAIAPLADIFKKWLDNCLDEDRPDWRMRRVDDRKLFRDVVLFSGRGGAMLLNLAHAYEAWVALGGREIPTAALLAGSVKPNDVLGLDVVEPDAPSAVPVTRWPFRETPGEFARRLFVEYKNGFLNPSSDAMLAAVRTVLIEEPPALAAWLDPGAAAQDSADYSLLKIALRHAFPDLHDDEPITPERVLALGVKFNKAILAFAHAESMVSLTEEQTAAAGAACGLLGGILEVESKKQFIDKFSDAQIERMTKIHNELMAAFTKPEKKSVETRRERKIITSFVHPPIPWRHNDWFAYFDGDEPDDEGTMLHGHGETEAEAIAELKRAAEDGDIDIYEAPPASPAPDGTSIELCHCGPDSRMNHYKGSRGCVHEKKHAPDCATHCRDQARHQHPCDCGAEVKS